MLCGSFPYLDISIMEARNFITAREMLTDGNWLLTTMNGEPRYQKPPLPTWLAAISATLFGIKSLFAYRLPGILMVVVLAITTFKFSNTLVRDRFHATINALILVTSFYVVAIVIEAPWDIFTHGFMLLGIYQLFLLFETSRTWKHGVLAGLFIGCSILSKGPVSPYALLLPFLLAYGFTFKFKNFKHKWLPFTVTMLLAILLGGWWYLFVRLEDPETFLSVAAKETGNWSSYNVRPFYYYWSFFTQSGIWTIPAFIGLLYPYLKTRVSNLKAYQFTLFWTLAAVVLLSLIPEKKSRYLMPVLIPLALNTGFYVEYLIRQFKDLKDKRETIPVYFNFGLIGIIGLIFFISGFSLGPFLRNQILVWFVMAAIVLFATGFFILKYLKTKTIKTVFYLTIVFVVSAFVFVAPLSKIQGQPGYQSISGLKDDLNKDGTKLYALGYVSPEMIWYFGDKIKSLEVNDSILVLPEENTFGLLARQLDLRAKSQLEDNYSIDEKTVYDLNRTPPNGKQYNTRLVTSYYILTKR